MGRDHNDDKKRALVMGKFKFLFQDDTEDLEAGDKFQLAVVQNKLLGPVVYQDKDGKDPDILKIYGKEREDIGKGFSDPDIKIPGALCTFTVVWTNPFGDIFLDSDIKLFEFEDIQKYSGYNDGPESSEFCRFYTSSNSKDLDGFDASIFWSAGFLWKHFKTCGVECWDKEFGDLVTHYRNWRDWTHKVHYLPSNEKRDKGDEGKRDGYNRTPSKPVQKKPIQTKPIHQRHNSGNNNSVVPPQYTVPPPSTPKILPTLTAPPMGQPIYLPLAGPDGKTVQVQLVTVPQTASMPPAPGSKFKYINPHHAPPPKGTQPHSSWTTQVDDFLSRPPKSPPYTRCSTPRLRNGCGDSQESPERKKTVNMNSSSEMPINLGNEKKRKRVKDKDEKGTKKTKKFRPKASILPPSPGGKEINSLDISPSSKMYVGKVTDWRGKFGFLTSEVMGGKIFLHSKDIVKGRDIIKLGCEAEFKVLHQDSSVVGAKAVSVRILA